MRYCTLSKNRNSEIAKTALLALENSGVERHKSVFIEMLNHKSVKLQSASLKILSTQQDPALKTLFYKHYKNADDQMKSD